MFSRVWIKKSRSPSLRARASIDEKSKPDSSEVRMAAFLPEWLKIALGTLVIVGFVLTRAARRFPEVEWLNVFRFADNLDPARRARMRRSSEIHAGAEIILLGIVVPPAYFVLTLMTWSDLSRGITIAVGAFSATCIALGVWVLWRTLKNRR
jgi:hypothetical protein